MVSETLRRVEELLNTAKFDEALQIIETMKNHKDLNAEDHLTNQLLKSQIFKVKGEYEKSLELAETALIESKNLNLSLQEVDAHIAIAGALENLDKYNESLEKIIQGDQIFATLTGVPSKVLTQRKAALMYQKGRSLWRKVDPERALTPLEQSLALYEELGNKYGKSLSLCAIGAIYYDMGDSDLAMEYYQQSLVLNAELGNKLGMAACLKNIGDYYYREKREVNQGLEYYQRSLALIKELDNKSEMALHLSRIADIQLYKGLDSKHMRQQAKETFREVIAIYEGIGNKERLARALMEIGGSHSFTGELEQALDYLHMGLVIFEEIEHKFGIAYSIHLLAWTHQCKGELRQALELCQKSLMRFDKIDESDTYPHSVWPRLNLGIIYQAMGDFEAATDNFRKCLAQSEESGTTFAAAYALFYLTTLAVDNDRFEEAKAYSQQLNILNSQGSSSNKIRKVSHRPKRVINSFSRITEALVLKTSSRLKDKVRAQEMFQQLVKEEPINFNINYFVMLNLCELLLFELGASGETDVFEETKSLVQRLKTQAQNQHSFPCVVNTLILQARLAMVEGDLITAAQFLDQAQKTAKEKSLARLIKKVFTEINQLESQYDKWQRLIQSNAPIQARLEQAQLKDYLKNAQRLARLEGVTAKTVR